MQPKTSIIIPITRHWALDKLFECLDDLICDTEKTELILYVDTDNNAVRLACYNYCDFSTKFTDKKVLISDNPAPSEVRINVRRDRIVEGREKIKELISEDSEYIFGVEDDTIFPADSIKRMLRSIQRKETGFVQGVQVGRWSIKYIGAWRVNDLENPTKILTLPFLNAEGKTDRFLERIDAGGFYCYMTKTKLFKEIKGEWHDDCFGPDVCYGLELRKQGFINYIDWGLICGHNDFGVIIKPDKDTKGVKYNKINNRWILQK